MAKYDRMTQEYVYRKIVLTLAFPADRVVCDLCMFCHTENSGTRFRCLQTGEILPFHNVDYGLRCPIFAENPPTKEIKGDDEA